MKPKDASNCETATSGGQTQGVYFILVEAAVGFVI